MCWETFCKRVAPLTSKVSTFLQFLWRTNYQNWNLRNNGSFENYKEVHLLIILLITCSHFSFAEQSLYCTFVSCNIHKMSSAINCSCNNYLKIYIQEFANCQSQSNCARGLANLSGLLGKGVRGSGGTLRRKEKEVSNAARWRWKYFMLILFSWPWPVLC
jgi:hypothetical protein